MRHIHPKKPVRLLIIEPEGDFLLSLTNRLFGLERHEVAWQSVSDVPRALELLSRHCFDLLAAGLPLPLPHGLDPAETCARVSGLCVLGFSDSGSTLFLHPGLSDNVILVLPKSRLDNALLDQALAALLEHARLGAALEAAQLRLLREASPPRVEPAPQRTDAVPAPPPPCAPTAKTELTVLLAEDNTINRLFATELLQREGHRVLTAQTGLEALEVLARERVDAVLMDIQMPEMDGVEATRLIRSGRTPGIPREVPIVAMTAHGLKGDRECYLQAGMNGYLAKPVDGESIRQALAGALAQGGAAAQPSVEPEGALLNEAWLLEKARGNREFLKKLFAVFLEKQPEAVADLRRAVTGGDLRQAAFMAHTLKGGSATMGAEILKECAFALEKAAKSENQTLAMLEMANLETAFERTLAAIEAFIGR